MRATLTHYWRMNLAVIAGAAVASAVLTGALIVGDSVRGSLKALTLERLGLIEYASAAPNFFPEDLADRLASSDAVKGSVAPAIILEGQARHAQSGARATQVGLQGVDERFLALFPEQDAAAFFPEKRPIFPPAVINQGLADALGAAEGDAILVSLQRWSDVPQGSLLSRKDTASVVRSLRLTVTKILPDRGIGRFRLRPHQSLPLNVFVPLETLQDALDQDEEINSLLVALPQPDAPAGDEAAAAEVDAALRAQLRPDDLGLRLTGPEDGEWFAVESREHILKPSLIAALDEATAQSSTPRLPIYTYIANDISFGERSVPYSTVTAIDPANVAAEPRFGALRLIDGSPAPALADDEILLNSWTAEQLGAAVGDRVDMTYFTVGPQEQLDEEIEQFTVRGVVAIEDLGADSSLAQEYPGISGNDDMSDWDPPFPIDLDLVRLEDEDYWDEYGATPKAFLAEATGRRLWQNRWGDLTAMRLIDAEPEAFAQNLLGGLELDAYGLRFLPLRSQGLEASSGSSDFAGLFVGLSFFLIIAAALLAAMLFSLGVEQRTGEIGLRLAVGEPPKKVRRRLLREGLLLSAVGGVLGLVGALLYGEFIVTGLRTWWRGAVGTSELELHLVPMSLIIGVVASVLVVQFAIWFAVRRISSIPAPRLLARATETVEKAPGRKSRRIAAICLPLAIAGLLYALAVGATESAAVFFLVGPAFLIGALALFASRMTAPRRSGGSTLGRPGPLALVRMAAANSGRNHRRSLTSVGLVASACFLIVALGVYQQGYDDADLGFDSGAGGYELTAESSIPLLQALDRKDGRFELGLSEEVDELLADATITPFRLLPGDDTSCLNLFQPEKPRVLGVPPAQTARGGFHFTATTQETDDPWSLLSADLGENVVPAFGDAASTQYILKLGLGKDLIMTNEAGEEIRLRLVGTLAHSVFQSELLISQEQMTRHFPSRAGASVFLIDVPEGTDVAALSTALEDGLEPYGFDAMKTGDKLAAFISVQNTYLSTFSALGVLALLLGTVGMAVVLLRNVIERRGELAMMRAFGFRRGALTWMVLLENALLLIAGLSVGALAAILTVAPHLLQNAALVPWDSLGGALLLVLVFGLAVCSVASFAALRTHLLPALKTDR